MRFVTRFGSALLAGLLMVPAVVGSVPARADNQTATVSKVKTDTSKIPYTIKLRPVSKTSKTLPNLQSFVSGEVDGLWVIIGGRTNGLHDFTNSGLKNFPPSKQNRRIWVIDPWTGNRWGRKLSDSSLTKDQVDALSSTAQQAYQVGNTLYVIGGYGYSRSEKNFKTFKSLTAFDLDKIVAWVRNPGSLPSKDRDLANLIRQTSHSILKVTGGHVTKLGSRTILAFGQLFDGGYGDPDFKQVYTEQVRSFTVSDDGKSVDIAKLRRDPTTPNPEDYRRRDYPLVPYLQMKKGKPKARAVALAGVFTETDGMFTVPVEIDPQGRPSMADPDDPSTFKQPMSGYDVAYLPIWDSKTKTSHNVLFAGISYVYYDKRTDTFVEDDAYPFIKDISVLTRDSKGKYKQTLLGQFPTVRSTDGKQLRFGAEAEVFVNPAMPVTKNGMIDLREVRKAFGKKKIVAGHLFGGIASDAGNNGNTVASNLIFKIVLVPR